MFNISQDTCFHSINRFTALPFRQTAVYASKPVLFLIKILFFPPDFYPIKTFFPQKANPYFRICSFEIPLATRTVSYACRSIRLSASCTVSDKSFSSSPYTLNSIIIASSNFDLGFNITSYLPNPLSRFEVIKYFSDRSTINPSTNP